MGINAHSAAMAAILVVLSASLLVTMAVVDEKPVVRQRAGSDGDGENSGWSNTFIHRKSSYSEFCLRSYVDYIGYLDISLTVFWWASSHSQGFEDEDLGSSPGWWAATVATYCPSRPGECPKFFKALRMTGRPPVYC